MAYIRDFSSHDQPRGVTGQRSDEKIDVPKNSGQSIRSRFATKSVSVEIHPRYDMIRSSLVSRKTLQPQYIINLQQTRDIHSWTHISQARHE
jgi:hypothetical protein